MMLKTLTGVIFKLRWLILHNIGQLFIALNGQKLNKHSFHLVTLIVDVEGGKERQI